MPARVLWYLVSRLLTATPWVFLVWLGEVIACRRWSGLERDASLLFSVAAAVHGWRLVWRWGERQHDLKGARLLATLPDPEPWELFPHPAQRLKAAHLSHCQRRWGVNARSSGWRLVGRAGWLDLVGTLVCMALSIHAWWLSI